MMELKRYFSYLGKYKYTYWFILSVTVISSATLGLLYSYMNKMFFNAVEYGNKELFAYAAGLCMLLVILKCLFPYLRYFSIRLVRKIVFDIKIRLFQKLMKLDMGYYEEHHSGEALKTLNWDANSLKDSYFSHVYWVLGKLVDGLTAVIAMIVYSPVLAGVSVAFSLVTVFVSVKINQRIKSMDKKIQGSLARIAERLSDILMGFTLLKMYRGASIVSENFERENENVTMEEKERVNRVAMLEMLSFLLGILGNFGTIITGAFFVARGKMDYGTVMAVVSLQMGVSTMMQKFGSSITTLSSSLVKAGRVFDFLELVCEEEVSKRTSDRKNQESDEEPKKRALDALTRSCASGDAALLQPLCINKLCFSYSGDMKVLDKLDIHVKDGERILLMGESGCGKSTLLKLLLRFYERDAGEIMLYGRDISEYSLEQLRQMITYIPQNSYLFEGTIRENIAFGNSGEGTVTEENIREAARLAYADEFIMQLPQGYDTRLDAGGSNLSGGQRQRIAIARAFMKDSPILLMDEPSSALDVQSEKMIHQAMKQLMQQRIVLMVTHRENSFDEFDRVVRL